MLSLPILPGFGPSQLKRSEHHYSRICYPEMGSIKSMDPAPTGLWCPLASYFSPCQSTRTLICWNTLMHCVTPWRMFIKLFFNEKQGSIADRGDSCIPTPMHLCSLPRISMLEDTDNMQESISSS